MRLQKPHALMFAAAVRPFVSVPSDRRTPRLPAPPPSVCADNYWVALSKTARVGKGLPIAVKYFADGVAPGTHDVVCKRACRMHYASRTHAFLRGARDSASTWMFIGLSRSIGHGVPPCLNLIGDFAQPVLHRSPLSVDPRVEGPGKACASTCSLLRAAVIHGHPPRALAIASYAQRECNLPPSGAANQVSESTDYLLRRSSVLRGDTRCAWMGQPCCRVWISDS